MPHKITQNTTSMLRKMNFFLFLALISLTFFTGCDDDDTLPPNEVELITTLIYTLTPVGGGAPAVFTFRDLDGDGGNPPVVTTATLRSGLTYTGSITVLNESETPAEDITEEIEEEDDEHQFFFTIGSGLNLSIAYADTDEDGNPIGLATTATAAAASSGNLTITLRHEPNKSATGVATGDITNAGGETDIAVTFEVTIQ